MSAAGEQILVIGGILIVRQAPLAKIGNASGGTRFAFVALKTGKSKATRILMMATTTSSSMSVNPRLARCSFVAAFSEWNNMAGFIRCIF